MDKLSLFQAALGIQDPWHVDKATFDPEQARLDVHLEFTKGARFPCPEGDEDACPVHDTTRKTWRHLDFFQHHAYLHAPVPRVVCPEHGTRQVTVPWARPGSGFTLLFEALLLELAPHMPIAALARLVREHDTRIWRLLEHYVEEARAAADHSEVTSVGIDETSARRGHDYVSLFMDLGIEKPRVLFATEGRDGSTLKRFAQDLSNHGGDPDLVTSVCCDMSPAFMHGVEQHLGNAEITFDRYHVVQQLGAAVDEVRRSERKDRPELTRTRYIWLKRPRTSPSANRRPWRGSIAPRFSLRPCALIAGASISMPSTSSLQSSPRPTSTAGAMAPRARAWNPSRTSFAWWRPTGTASSDGTPPRFRTVFWRASTR